MVCAAVGGNGTLGVSFEGPIPKNKGHGRIKARYNPTPTKREKDYHAWLMENFPCACGCGGQSTVVHHPLERHWGQRWRRDHEFVVPMNGFCHMDLHRKGSETGRFEGMSAKAFRFRKQAIEGGKL